MFKCSFCNELKPRLFTVYGCGNVRVCGNCARRKCVFCDHNLQLHEAGVGQCVHLASNNDQVCPCSVFVPKPSMSIEQALKVATWARSHVDGPLDGHEVKELLSVVPGRDPKTIPWEALSRIHERLEATKC